MIKEVYIDNFRCLTNFRVNLGAFQLWLGDNGSGKTSVLDALRKIQQVLRGEHIEDIFLSNSLTRWDKRPEQRFGFSLELDGEIYDYQLIIEHNRQLKKSRIKREELKWKDSTFFLYDNGEAHLYRQNRQTQATEEGTSFSADWSRSVISNIAPREDNQPLLLFRNYVNTCLMLHPVPLVVNQIAEGEAKSLSQHAENFAQWYRHLLQEDPSVGYKAREHLKHILPGFDQLSLKNNGEARRLTATFRVNEEDTDFDFLDLSDGQRQLIVLYTMLEALRAGSVATLFVDEPDNFVSLREIQPWIENLKEVSDDENKQAIIISHHPNITNQMARGSELWFSRPNGSLAVTKPFPKVEELTPAEIVARGWESNE